MRGVPAYATPRTELFPATPGRTAHPLASLQPAPASLQSPPGPTPAPPMAMAWQWGEGSWAGRPPWVSPGSIPPLAPQSALPAFLFIFGDRTMLHKFLFCIFAIFLFCRVISVLRCFLDSGPLQSPQSARGVLWGATSGRRASPVSEVVRDVAVAALRSRSCWCPCGHVYAHPPSTPSAGHFVCLRHLPVGYDACLTRCTLVCYSPMFAHQGLSESPVLDALSRVVVFFFTSMLLFKPPGFCKERHLLLGLQCPFLDSFQLGCHTVQF